MPQDPEASGFSIDAATIYGSKYFVCNDFNKSGSSLCVSMECGLAGAPTPVIMDDANLGNAGDHDKVEKVVQRSDPPLSLDRSLHFTVNIRVVFVLEFKSTIRSFIVVGHILRIVHVPLEHQTGLHAFPGLNSQCGPDRE